MGVVVPLQGAAVLAALPAGRIDARPTRDRAQALLHQHGVHTRALLTLQRQRADRVEQIDRAPETTGAPGDALSADTQGGVAPLAAQLGPVQAVHAIDRSPVHVAGLGLPVLRHRLLLLLAELRRAQVAAQQDFVVVLQIETQRAAELALELQPQAVDIQGIGLGGPGL